MKINEKELMGADLEAVFKILNQFKERVDVEELFRVAFGHFKFSKASLNQMLEETTNF